MIMFRRNTVFSNPSRSLFTSWKPVALLLLVPVFQLLFSEINAEEAEAPAAVEHHELGQYFEAFDRKISR